jgi:hypothetical protein
MFADMQKLTLAAYCVEVWKHWETCFGTTFAVILGAIQYSILAWADPAKVPAWVKSFPPWLWLAIGCVLLFWSCYLAWKDKQISLNVSESRVGELKGRPDLHLSCKPVEHDWPGKPNLPPPPQAREPRGFKFLVINSGPVQAVNVFIREIVLPMSDVTQKQHLEMHERYKQEKGIELAAPSVGWNIWTVKFLRVDVPAGAKETTELPYSIDNMGPLQRQDLCGVLAGTIRTGDGYIFLLPLTLEFSNRDGTTWRQQYELERKLVPCSIRLMFKSTDLVT